MGNSGACALLLVAFFTVRVTLACPEEATASRLRGSNFGGRHTDTFAQAAEHATDDMVLFGDLAPASSAGTDRHELLTKSFDKEMQSIMLTCVEYAVLYSYCFGGPIMLFRTAAVGDLRSGFEGAIVCSSLCS